MSQVPWILTAGRYTATGLHRRTRALHQPRVALLNLGWVCVAAAGGLSLLGIIAIGTTEPGFALRQLIHLGVGLFAATIVATPHYRLARDLSYPLLFLVLGLLVFVLIPFVPDAIVHPRNGARRWINLYLTDFQPSELAKIVYVLAMANYLRSRRTYRRFFGLLAPLGLTLIPMGLILREPDLGTAMLFLPTLFAMLVAAGAKLRHLAAIALLGLAAAPMMYPMLQPHQKDRIRAMVAQMTDDRTYEQDIGYQGAQAMTLAGAGQITGVGKQRAADLIEHNHLPEEHNDMIFAVICLRWGLTGALLTWGLFATLAGGGLLVAATCRDSFGRLVAVGLVALIFTQMTINTGMTIGLMPITGLTLPFVSYGGTSLVSAWLMIGLMLNIAMRRPITVCREVNDFDEEDGGS